MLMFSNYHEQKKVFLEIGRHAFLFLFHRLKRTIANQGRVKFGLFRPLTVIYVGNDTLFTFIKISFGDFKKSFSLAIIVPDKCDYILTFLRYIRTTGAKYPYLPPVPTGSLSNFAARQPRIQQVILYVQYYKLHMEIYFVLPFILILKLSAVYVMHALLNMVSKKDCSIHIYIFLSHSFEAFI